MKPTYSLNALLLAGLACLALSGSACGGDDGGITTKSDAGDEPDDEVDASALMCSGSETKSCTCSSGATGRKTCRNSKFGGCVCGVATKDAGPIGNTQDLCKAGYYAGGFTGKYKPGFAGGGIFPSGFEVTIDGIASAGQPALAFTLDENSSGPAGEFHTFTVGNGCMVGNAQVYGFIDNPFVARITGTLDCATGYFDGHLDGQYTLLNVSPVPSLFSGPLTSQFYLPQSLKDGEWNVFEPPSLSGDPMGGGNGTWNADWSAEAAPVQTTDPCAAVTMLIDGGVYMADPTTTPPVVTPPKDASTPVTTPKDAGVRDAGTP